MATSIVTVSICTHRPRLEALVQTLDALREQTLPFEQWELMIVGDRETIAIVERAGLTGLPPTVFVEEAPRGIARARVRALREFLSRPSDLLLFVDDDNLLAPDYLEIGVGLAKSEPNLGCWGGQLIGRFEAAPPEWMHQFFKYIAVFPLDREMRASRYGGTYDAVPPTAGMFLRRREAEHHLQLVESQPQRLALGGTRGIPIGGEDTDLGLGAFDLGHEIGRFPQLKLIHLIPAGRMTENYIARLLTSIRAGMIILEAVRGFARPKRSYVSLGWDCLRALRMPARHRKFMLAETKGEFIARRMLAQMQIPSPQ